MHLHRSVLAGDTGPETGYLSGCLARTEHCSSKSEQGHVAHFRGFHAEANVHWSGTRPVRYSTWYRTGL